MLTKNPKKIDLAISVIRPISEYGKKYQFLNPANFICFHYAPFLVFPHITRFVMSNRNLGNFVL
jgi:hypothetical protein